MCKTLLHLSLQPSSLPPSSLSLPLPLFSPYTSHTTSPLPPSLLLSLPPSLLFLLLTFLPTSLSFLSHFSPKLKIYSLCPCSLPTSVYPRSPLFLLLLALLYFSSLSSLSPTPRSPLFLLAHLSFSYSSLSSPSPTPLSLSPPLSPPSPLGPSSFQK
jgi:hypothetical protein